MFWGLIRSSLYCVLCEFCVNFFVIESTKRKSTRPSELGRRCPQWLLLGAAWPPTTSSAASLKKKCFPQISLSSLLSPFFQDSRKSRQGGIAGVAQVPKWGATGSVYFCSFQTQITCTSGSNQRGSRPTGRGAPWHTAGRPHLRPGTRPSGNAGTGDGSLCLEVPCPSLASVPALRPPRA